MIWKIFGRFSQNSYLSGLEAHRPRFENLHFWNPSDILTRNLPKYPGGSLDGPCRPARSLSARPLPEKAHMYAYVYT